MSKSKDRKEFVCKHYCGNSWGHCGHPSNAGRIYQESRIGCTNAEENCRGFVPGIEVKKKDIEKSEKKS